VTVSLQLETARFLTWEIAAAGDARIIAVEWHSEPARAWSDPPFSPLDLAAGTPRRGKLALQNEVAWIEVRLVVRDGAGEWTTSASARPPRFTRPEPPLAVAPKSKPATGATGATSWVRASFHYEDRLLDARGYRGTAQILPLRFVDVDLLDAGDRVLLRSALDAEGQVRLGPIPENAGWVRLRIHSAVRRHPRWRLDVVEPRTPQSGIEDVRAHTLDSEWFAAGAGEIDLGTLLCRDPDGFGRVQAFHILDNAVDVWEAIADPAWLGRSPGREDSLRIFWGPGLRIRGSAFGNGLIEIASPASGDTDGWSDAVILHEVGHYVAHRFLRDDTPGGAHLLGDVHQDPRLASSEGFATAFACWVRERRARGRRNQAGAPMDGDVALFVNAGMPPPGGQPGGLQYVWDVESHTLGGAPLVQDGTESETNLAGVWLDLVDAPAGERADDDRSRAPLREVFAAFESLRQADAPAGITFEDFWRAWQPSPAWSELLHAARIEYELDAAEPDQPPREPPSLWSSAFEEPSGGIVIAEIWTAPAVAVELVNRDLRALDVGGWQLLARSNDASQNPSLTYTIPSGIVLGPGARLLVVRSGRPRDDTTTRLHAPGWTVPWFPGFDGALGLRDAAGRGVDFVRWDARTGNAPSRVVPIPGTQWSGNLPAALPGNSLARRDDRPDADRAGDFADATPTPGGPNDAPGVHRTFFPAGDVDRMRWWIRDDGTYTIQARRQRGGAVPEIEILLPGEPERRVVARAADARGDARITLSLRAGTDVEARFRHAGTLTRLGSYDIAAWREPDPSLALPPTALRVDVGPGSGARSVSCAWWNASHYDSIAIRVAGQFETRLEGGAQEATLLVPEGRHEFEIAGWTRGLRNAAPTLVVAVEDWPASFTEAFTTWPNHDWESDGWGAVALPERGGVLTDSPQGDYANDRIASVRLRTAVIPAAGSTLQFAHACIVRPEDAAWVEATTDWGATWTGLARYDWNARPDGAWRDGRADAEDWREESLPLAAFAGRPLQIRFRLASDVFGRADGWWLDDIRLTAAVAPPRLALRPNVPNPFNPTTTIHFDVPHPGAVVLRILDVRGRWIRTLLDAPLAPGAHAVVWDGRDAHGRGMASGVYISELRAGTERAARTLVLVH
jgi:hypothetical protein